MRKADIQKSLEVLIEDPKINYGEEYGFLCGLLALQKEAILGFRLINKKITFSALNVFLLQGLSQSKAFWEEINQLILIHLGEANILNTVKEKIPEAYKKLKKDVVKDDMHGLIENIKVFEEYVISYYQRVMNEPLHENTRTVLENQLEALHSRYHHLVVLEKKIKSDK
ncbi:MAG: hypothetical protein K0S53_525 [Bacteroidetes bacterium]|jgi:hypothetical protein|nr:hypothetical protein [Bacteroidota bacterium]